MLVRTEIQSIFNLCGRPHHFNDSPISNYRDESVRDLFCHLGSMRRSDNCPLCVCRLEQVVSQSAFWPGAPCERLLSAPVAAV